MTISFAVPLDCNSTGYYNNNNKEDAVGAAAVVDVAYRKKKHSGDDDNAWMWVTEDHHRMNQYNSTSDGDGEDVNYYISPYFHHFSLEGLEASTEYEYVCILLTVGKEVEQSEIRRLGVRDAELGMRVNVFRTAPVGGSSAESYKVGVIADFGMTERSVKNYESILSQKFDVHLIVGDISYANSNHTIWDDWFVWMEEIARSSPVMPSPGNHERETDVETGSIFDAYENRFLCPQVSEAIRIPQNPEESSTYVGTYDYGNSFYSFSAGLGLFIFLNPYTSAEEGSPQYNFLKETLESVDRNISPWIFVSMHCPFYNTFDRHVDESQTIQMKSSLEPLFVEYQVNIVFSGHTHGYSRSYPVAFDEVDQEELSPIYINIGDGGRKSEAELYQSMIPESWVEVRDGFSVSHGSIEFLNSTHILWTRFLAMEGEIYEEVSIRNQYDFS